MGEPARRTIVWPLSHKAQKSPEATPEKKKHMTACPEFTKRHVKNFKA
jgi:hypothetical protein